MEKAGVDSAALTGLGVHGAALDGNASAPEWIELLPAGVFRGRDGRGPFRLADAGAVIEATRALRMSAGIPIDYDHATDLAAPEGRPAPAAGWIRELAERDGAVWGRVQWTRHGAAAVTTREYRYVSPVFEHRKDGVVVRLLRAALTNNPNLYLTAISSMMTDADDSYAANNAEREGESMDLPLTEIRSLLGLGPDAGAEEILDGIRALTTTPQAGANAARAAEGNLHDGAVDLGRYVPLAHFQKTVGELNQLRALHARERAERLVDEATRAGKIVPAQREWAIAYCAADEAGFNDFVARQPAVALGAIAFADAPAGARRDEERAAAALTAAEAAVCAHLGVDAEDYARRKRAGGDPRRLNP